MPIYEKTGRGENVWQVVVCLRRARRDLIVRGTRADAERAELGLMALMEKVVPSRSRWHSIARHARKVKSDLFIYFIQAGANGAIKIGRTDDVYARLDTLQTANAEELRLLLFIDGDRALETTFHAHFVKDHIRGEWFRPSPELLQFVRDLDAQSEKR